MSLVIIQNQKVLEEISSSWEPEVTEDNETTVSDVKWLLSTINSLSGLRIIHSDGNRRSVVLDLAREGDDKLAGGSEHFGYLIFVGNIPEEIKTKAIARFSKEGQVFEIN